MSYREERRTTDDYLVERHGTVGDCREQTPVSGVGHWSARYRRCCRQEYATISRRGAARRARRCSLLPVKARKGLASGSAPFSGSAGSKLYSA